MKIVWCVVITWFGMLAGCAPEPFSPPDASFNPVVGRAFSTCHQGPGDVDIPDDLSHRIVQALVPDSSAWGYRVVDGSGSADGTFVINNVPVGVTYMLQIDALRDAQPEGARFPFYVTDQRVLELRREWTGRCSPRAVTGSASAIVNLSLTKMTQFSPGSDRLELDSFSLGTGIELPARGNFGDAFDGSVQWPQDAPLVDAAAGDDLHILHMRSDYQSGPTTGRARRIEHVLDWFDATGKSLQVGPATVITGQFPPLSPIRTGSLLIAHDQFNADYDATGSSSATSVWLDAHPWSSSAGTFFGRSATLLGVTLYEPFGGRIASGTSTTSYSYADPFPASWRRTLSIDHGRAHHVRLSSTVPAISIVGGYQQRIEAPIAVEVGPRMAPPTGITVAGVDFALGGKIAFHGPSPIVVRWNPVPSAQVYRLSLIHATTDPAVPDHLVSDVVTTSDTSLVLTAAMFASGTIYQFQLAAIQTPTDYRAGQLEPAPVPRVTAAVPSGRFRFTVSCGDGILQPEEDCDTAGESATCNVDCTTPLCGDGLRNAAAGEACDNTVGCEDDCTLRGTP